MKNTEKGNRGSISVEAAIIVPLVIITLLVVFNLVLLVFQTGIMYSTSNEVAERIAANYYKNGVNQMTGEISKQQIEALGLYRRWSAVAFPKVADYKHDALSRFQKKSLLKSSDSSLEFLSSGSAISPRITVLLSSSYDNPLGSITSVWGVGNKIGIKVNAEASIDDPAEFVRNTDFILETAARVPVIKEFGARWQQIINRVVNYVNKISKGLGNG